MERIFLLWCVFGAVERGNNSQVQPWINRGTGEQDCGLGVGRNLYRGKLLQDKRESKNGGEMFGTKSRHRSRS